MKEPARTLFRAICEAVEETSGHSQLPEEYRPNTVWPMKSTDEEEAPQFSMSHTGHTFVHGQYYSGQLTIHIEQPIDIQGSFLAGGDIMEAFNSTYTSPYVLNINIVKETPRGLNQAPRKEDLQGKGKGKDKGKAKGTGNDKRKDKDKGKEDKDKVKGKGKNKIQNQNKIQFSSTTFNNDKEKRGWAGKATAPQLQDMQTLLILLKLRVELTQVLSRELSKKLGLTVTLGRIMMLGRKGRILDKVTLRGRKDTREFECNNNQTKQHTQTYKTTKQKDNERRNNHNINSSGMHAHTYIYIYILVLVLVLVLILLVLVLAQERGRVQWRSRSEHL